MATRAPDKRSTAFRLWPLGATSLITALWTIAVILCCVGQPLTLGFYTDDWPIIAAAARAGAPFSKARLQYAYSIDPTRLGMAPQRFLFSSLFANRVFLWHCGLVLANFLVALVLIRLIRVLSSGNATAKASAIWIGLCWMLLPWNAAALFWPTYLPNVIMLAAFGLLAALLVQGWSNQRHNAVLAGLLYLWICLTYEAFYFQWIALGLLGLALTRTGRARLREVAFSTTALLIAQLGAAFWHLYSKNLAAPGFAGVEKPIVSDWPRILFGDLLTTIPSMFRSFGEVRIPFAVLALLLGAIWLVNLYQSLRSPELPPDAWAPFILAAACLAGAILSIFAFALGGRGIQATGMATRTLFLFNFWFVAGAGISVPALLDRAGPSLRLTVLVILGGLGITLAAGHQLRRADWATAWALETKILADAPVEALRKTPANVRILYIHPRTVNGAPIFATPWDLNLAMPWKYPFLAGRVFVVFNPDQGSLTWDGRKLAYQGHAAVETAPDLYIWRPAQASFQRAGGPFHVTRSFAIEDLPTETH